MEWVLEESWREKLKDELDKSYYKELVEKVTGEYRNNACYPPEEMIFNAFNLCPFHKVKVVIVGQDPYFKAGQAMGLSFSVSEKESPLPSLRTIYKALGVSIDGADKPSGDLTRWVEQGVLLLNTTLTVRENQPNSHRKYKWRLFTDAVIRALDADREHIVFMLWGRIAQRKERFVHVDNDRHMVLKAVHPSPLAFCRYGEWDGKDHFGCCNIYLKENGIVPVDWMVVGQ
ncbi:uracil-DNA glycosylase [Prevotella fusca]|uniref:Uracil-DNA glycosylase n=1 Tax=Prevotella fusca JCM 17724 TaxID=1236517 RepID=A0A0K1NK31_9BACT|nr:uracil-DNA glycosylase [Prevotella fusca]AKU69243.1 uracil-DNA glycosylase [Prevotella fusca JCM 17724]QUB86873.1 uracil-DNA glycosylase [Prevotella fusca JCM 17724]